MFYPYVRPRAHLRLCNNGNGARRITLRRATTMLNVRMNQGKRILLWVILTVLAALVAYFGIRGYLSPELLFNFSNSFYC